jgi:hypothetical protein
LTVPVEDPPQTTEVGENVRVETIPAGLTVKLAEVEALFKVAFRVSVSVVCTTEVEIVTGSSPMRHRPREPPRDPRFRPRRLR